MVEKLLIQEQKPAGGDVIWVHHSEYNNAESPMTCDYVSNTGEVKPAVGTAYTKPSTGIPKTDFASAVQTSLGKADSAYQKPSTGIPASDLAPEVLSSVGSAGSSTGGGLIERTYSELKALRDGGELVPGTMYRITDYVTTTVQENTQSAGHAFDLIVTADSANKINEKAHAVIHSGDTYFTTAGAKLEAWEIWYCLDNDTTRFAWADSTNGKGVIYRMIDEWSNECPYDFKNIQFKRKLDSQGTFDPTSGVDTWVYTFDCMLYGGIQQNDVVIEELNEHYDNSTCWFYSLVSTNIKQKLHDNNVEIPGKGVCFGNIVKECSYIDYTTPRLESASALRILNDNVFLSSTLCGISEYHGEEPYVDVTTPGPFVFISFAQGCSLNTVETSDGCGFITVGKGCVSNHILGGMYVTLDAGCCNNRVNGQENKNITIGTKNQTYNMQSM